MARPLLAFLGAVASPNAGWLVGTEGRIVKVTFE